MNILISTWKRYRIGLMGTYCAVCISYIMIPMMTMGRGYNFDFLTLLAALLLFFTLVILYFAMMLCIARLYNNAEIILRSFWVSFFFVLTQIFITNQSDTFIQSLATTLSNHDGIQKILVEIGVFLTFGFSVVVVSSLKLRVKKK